MKKIKTILLGIIIGTTIFVILGLNNMIQATDYLIEDQNIPDAFNDFIIAQLSDLHCESFGEHQSQLIAAVKNGHPDIIVLTGDIIDANKKDYQSVSDLVSGLVQIAPVYAVFGNHECDAQDIYEKMTEIYKQYGVNLMLNSGTYLTKETERIYLYGLTDSGQIKGLKRYFNANIAKPEADAYGILLYHRSTQFDYLANYGFKLVLSGHLHGGLIRIPLLGGLLSPDGTLFPKYDGGKYMLNGTTLISSRGFAGWNFIPRLYNRPELVFISLRK